MQMMKLSRYAAPALRRPASRLASGAVALALAAGVVWGGGWGAPRQAQAQTRVYPTELTNIAAAANGGRVLSVSSVIDDDKSFSASNLIDGEIYDSARKSGSNGWASNKFDPLNMDYVTLGFKNNALKRIGKIVLSPSAAVAPERWAKDIEVQVSTDTAQGPYHPIQQLTLRRTPERQEFVILPAQARFVRLMFRSNWGSDRAVALGEVEIYEAIDQTDPVGLLIARLESAITDLKRYRDTQTEIGDIRSASLTGDEAAPSELTELGPDTLNLVRLASDAKPSGSRSDRADSRGPVNLALAANGGRIVGYSSVFENDPQYGPDNLINGQNYSFANDKGSYGWSSEGFEPGREFVTIGFRDDRTHLIGKVIVNPASNQSALRWASRIDVQVTTESAKNGPWRTVATINVRQEPVNQDFTFRPVEAKYVRFVFVANGPGSNLPFGTPGVSSDRSVSLGEVEIYEPALASGDLEQIIGRLSQVLIDFKRMRADLRRQTVGARATSADVTGDATGDMATDMAADETATPNSGPENDVQQSVLVAAP
jgi:F5/8 type C domain